MKNMNRAEFLLRLDGLNAYACAAARKWIAENPGLSPAQLWRRCRRPDWMLWLVDEAGGSHAPSQASNCYLFAWMCLAKLKLIRDDARYGAAAKRLQSCLSTALSRWLNDKASSSAFRVSLLAICEESIALARSSPFGGPDNDMAYYVRDIADQLSDISLWSATSPSDLQPSWLSLAEALGEENEDPAFAEMTRAFFPWSVVQAMLRQEPLPEGYAV